MSYEMGEIFDSLTNGSKILFVRLHMLLLNLYRNCTVALESSPLMSSSEMNQINFSRFCIYMFMYNLAAAPLI